MKTASDDALGCLDAPGPLRDTPDIPRDDGASIRLDLETELGFPSRATGS